MMNKYSFESYLVFFVFNFILSIFFKLFFIDSFSAIFLSSLFEFSFLSLLLCFAFLVHLPKKFFSFFVYFSIWVFYLQSYFMLDLIERKDSLFALNFDVVIFFFIEILPISFFILCIFILIVLMYLRKKYVFSFLLKKRVKVTLALVCFFLCFSLPTIFSHSFSNLYVNTASSFKNSILYEEIRFNSSTPSFAYEQNQEQTLPFPKQKVFVFVMEGVDVEDVSSQRYSGDILDILEPHLHTYSQYYTQNQDSRTSLMSLFSGTFIPYEAYLHNYDYVYGHVFDQYSLQDYFLEQQYSTQYFISAMELPVIGERYNWSSSTTLEEFPLEDFTCIHQLAYQRACEDEALLGEVLSSLSSEENSFIFQEGVYGHGSDFYKMEGASSYYYYSEYLKKIFFYLEVHSLLNDVRIVVVSDHGSKDRFSMKSIEGYHIPLYIYDTSYTKSIIDERYSHLDFFELLLGISVEPRDEMFIVGSTMSHIVAYFGDDGDSFMNYGRVPYIFDQNINASFTELENIFSSFKNYQRDYFRE